MLIDCPVNSFNGKQHSTAANIGRYRLLNHENEITCVAGFKQNLICWKVSAHLALSVVWLHSTRIVCFYHSDALLIASPDTNLIHWTQISPNKIYLIAFFTVSLLRALLLPFEISMVCDTVCSAGLLIPVHNVHRAEFEGVHKKVSRAAAWNICENRVCHVKVEFI